MVTTMAGIRSRAEAQEARPPDVVLIVADDMRADLLASMPVASTLGVGYDHMIVANPVCCPSRASILTGLYSHSTGVYRNQPPDGGFESFDDSDTLATRLGAAGYRTALLGKYLNGYGRDLYVPPGWDRWHAFAVGGGGSYEDWDAVDWERGGPEPTLFQAAPGDYATDWIAAEARRLIETTPADRPLFLYLSAPAPHSPFTPAPRHEGVLAGLEPYRPESFDEEDVSDKPQHVERLDRLTAEEVAEVDRIRQAQLETLMALDELVAGTLLALGDAGRLDTATVIFTSDNGYHWGEHRIAKGKGDEYREAIEVPLQVLTPGAVTGPREDLAQNVDLAPTIAELAGVDWPGREGISLLPNLLGVAPTRPYALVEHADGGVPAFCQVRTRSRSFVHLTTGEEELYKLARDPLELRNVAYRPANATLVDELRAKARELCDPVPPGFTW